MESSFSIEQSDYFNTVESPTGQTPIADPDETDLNQLFVRYENAEWMDVNVVGGATEVKRSAVSNLYWPTAVTVGVPLNSKVLLAT